MPRTRAKAPGAAASSRDPDVFGPLEDHSDARGMTPAAQAQQICLLLLTTRPRSRAELAAALHKRGIQEELGEFVLDRLGELGLVNDSSFAEAAVYSGHRRRGLGRRALHTVLQRRGVSEEVARQAVAVVTPEDEEQRARELVRRRLGTSTVRDDRLARKLSAMLARKGYSEGLAWRVVRDELGPDICLAETEPCPD